MTSSNADACDTCVPRPLLRLLLAGTAAALASLAWRRYRRDMASARRRLRGHSSVVATAAGPIEVAQTGSGLAILFVHGSAGGFDQGLLLADMLGPSYHAVAPSRFGYLRTPLPADDSPEAQAAAHTALLDALGISQAVVVGISAGGPSALRMALRHPDRCTALIMISALSRPLLPQMPLLEGPARLAMARDFPYWLMTRIEPLLIKSLGIPNSVFSVLSPAQQAWISEFVQTTLPISLRREGILHDLRVTATAPPPPLEQVAAPTLVLHAADDTLAPLSQAEFTAARIPGARLIVLPSGGHLLLGQHERVRSEIVAFLGQVLPT